MQILIIVIRIYNLWIVKSRLNRYETKTSSKNKFFHDVFKIFFLKNKKRCYLEI